MSTALVERASEVEPTQVPTVTFNPVTPFDTIDLSSVSAEEAFRIISGAATTTGVACISNLSVRPPISAIQNLFSALYADATLVQRLNATYPKRGVFKSACLNSNAPPDIDQKTTIDLSIKRLEGLRDMDPALVEALGQDFSDVLEFYATAETELLPILLKATSSISGTDLGDMHNGTNNHLRLIDYFQCEKPSGPRCGEHRDYNTYTIIFQDGSVGGLEFEVDGKWIKVPAHVQAVVSWGWCGAIFSNDAITAAKHRVETTWPVTQRRTTAVVFVAPDLDTPLKPVGGLDRGDQGWRPEIMEGKLSVGAFKEVIAKKWRRREGNEPGEVVQGAQDREVEAFLRPN